jgi:hypothetical protein
MTNHSMLFTKLMKFIHDSGLRFHDMRTAVTCGWALVGLLISETNHLNHWALYRPGLARMSSKERQFSRWLHNDKIRPMLLYPKLVQHALVVQKEMMDNSKRLKSCPICGIYQFSTRSDAEVVLFSA